MLKLLIDPLVIYDHEKQKNKKLFKKIADKLIMIKVIKKISQKCNKIVTVLILKFIENKT